MQKTTYRAVLMDFLMPVLDGISATAMYRQWERTNHRKTSGKQFIIGKLASKHGGILFFVFLFPAEILLLIHSSFLSFFPFFLRPFSGISANAEEQDLAAARTAGIDHFISKPVQVNEVVTFITKYCKSAIGADGGEDEEEDANGEDVEGAAKRQKLALNEV